MRKKRNMLVALFATVLAAVLDEVHKNPEFNTEDQLEKFVTDNFADM